MSTSQVDDDIDRLYKVKQDILFLFIDAIVFFIIFFILLVVLYQFIEKHDSDSSVV
jgi:hypothetical protein